MSRARPLVDYYTAQNISPVAQDVTRETHFQQRESLYRSLGIPPLYVRGRRLVEVGPGSGHHAMYTASLGPSRYVLVDGNPRGISDCRERFASTDFVDVVQSFVEDYEPGEPFDLVLAEGIVTFQYDPAAFTRTIARWTRANGILVITTADAASFMGDIGRRLLADRIAPPAIPIAQRLEMLRPVFAPQLAMLDGMSRPVDDWLYDNVLQPMLGKTFGIDEAIAALDCAFDIYGSSPEFVLDWRWYKKLAGEDRAFNARALEAYYANILNFLDYRVTLPAHDAKYGRSLLSASNQIYLQMQKIESGDGAVTVSTAVPYLQTLCDLVGDHSPRTSAALRELVAFLVSDAPGDPNAHLGEFATYFGRGQQYLSFIRRADGDI